MIRKSSDKYFVMIFYISSLNCHIALLTINNQERRPLIRHELYSTPVITFLHLDERDTLHFVRKLSHYSLKDFLANGKGISPLGAICHALPIAPILWVEQKLIILLIKYDKDSLCFFAANIQNMYDRRAFIYILLHCIVRLYLLNYFRVFSDLFTLLTK